MAAPDTIPVILLAAGKSARMRGADKLLQDVDGMPLIRRQALLARSVTNGPLIIALPADPGPRTDALTGIDATLLPVADADEGMNASLRAAFAALPGDAPAAMLLLGDLPDLTQSDLRRVLAATDLASDSLIWRGATEDGKPGHPVVFARALFDQFAQLHGDNGGRDVVAKAAGRIALVPLPGQHARRDLDTPEDWADWRTARAKP